MTEYNIKNINYDQFLEFSSFIRSSVLLVVFIIFIFFGYLLDTAPTLRYLEVEKEQETVLQDQVLSFNQRLLVLEKYEEQSSLLKNVFYNIINQFPEYSETSQLLDNINKIGIDNGLEFQFFKPLNEEKTKYYSIMPVKIIITGNYHQFGYFISQLMNLNRVLSIKNFKIYVDKNNDNNKMPDKKLIMETTLHTYKSFDAEAMHAK